MKNKIIEIAAIISWTIGCVLLGHLLNEHDWADAPAINAAKPYSVWLPTPKELQEILLVEQDGHFGPKTMKAWYEYLNDYNGVKACLEAGMK